MIETQTLGSAVGIQYQGVQDRTEGIPLPTLNNGVLVGKFKRGRTDKPFNVTKNNFRAMLGYDPTNPSYMAVEDYFERGNSELKVMRVGSSGKSQPSDNESGGGSGGNGSGDSGWGGGNNSNVDGGLVPPNTTPIDWLLFDTRESVVIQNQIKHEGDDGATNRNEVFFAIEVNGILFNGDLSRDLLAVIQDEPSINTKIGGFRTSEGTFSLYLLPDCNDELLIRLVPSVEQAKWSPDYAPNPNYTGKQGDVLESVFVFKLGRIVEQVQPLLFKVTNASVDTAEPIVITLFDNAPNDLVWSLRDSSETVIVDDKTPNATGFTTTQLADRIEIVFNNPAGSLKNLGIAATANVVRIAPQDPNIWEAQTQVDITQFCSSVNQHHFAMGSMALSVPPTLPASITDLTDMFKDSKNIVSSVIGWDVSRVSVMAGTFENTIFNQNIGGWDVGAVNDMSRMFKESRSFSQNIGAWDVSSVNDMSYMFYDAKSFNQDIGGWVVNNVSNMDYMFNTAERFNQNLSYWCVTKIPALPAGFADSAYSFVESKHPVWGACPKPKITAAIIANDLLVNNRLDMIEKGMDWTVGDYTEWHVDAPNKAVKYKATAESDFASISLVDIATSFDGWIEWDAELKAYIDSIVY